MGRGGLIGREVLYNPLQQEHEKETLSQTEKGRVVNFVVQLEVEV